MYRNEFPDAPGLFTQHNFPNNRRSRRNTTYYRPTLLEEFKASWLSSTIGIIMIVVGLGMSFWNEGKTVQTARSLDEGFRKIITPETTDVVFDENNGKLVLVSGGLNIEDKLEDPPYGISIQAVKVKKRVQMYQWYEIEDPIDPESGDSEHKHATYSYDKDWFESPIDSNTFNSPMGHHNPEYWPINSTLMINGRVKIGGFLLGTDLKDMFDEFIPFTSDERPQAVSGIKMHAGLYFHSQDVWNPDVGDVRIQFSYAGRHTEQVTVVGKQSGREIRPYQTETGDELLFLKPGLRKAHDVFQAVHAENRFEMWIYRFLGWFCSFLGFSCVGTLLDILVDDHPTVRNVLALGVTNLSFSFSVSTTLIVIGVGWIVYRPLLGLTLLSFALSPFILAGYRIYRRINYQNRHRLS